jgi:hypothetical protein
LHAYGIQDHLLSWIKSFLSNRTQSVRVGTAVSNATQVGSGVPQGACISPLLFLIYINELPQLITSASCKLFADDVKIYASFPRRGETEDVSKALTVLSDWSMKWQVEIAIEKCAMIHIGFANREKKYELSGIKLINSNYIRDLGITISQDLKVATHCANIRKKAYSRACLILRAMRTNDFQILIKAYTTYVRPLLEYATCIWNPHLIKDIETIENVQKYFTRSVFKRCFANKAEYLKRLDKLGLETLEYRRLKFDLIMCFKIMRNLVDISMEELFGKQPDTVNAAQSGLRSYHQQKIAIGKTPKQDTRRYFFSERIVLVWNELPSDVISAHNLDTFRSRLNMTDLRKLKSVVLSVND